MSRYYLNIEQDGEVIEDLEGADFDSLDAVRQEAIAAAREIMSDRISKGKPASNSVFNIIDDEHRTVLRVPFRAAIADE